MKCKNYDASCCNCIGCDYIDRSDQYNGYKWCFKSKEENDDRSNSKLDIKENEFVRNTSCEISELDCEVYWRSPTTGEKFCISHMTDIWFSHGIGEPYGELCYRLYYNTLHGIESRMVYHKLLNEYGRQIRRELIKAKEYCDNAITLFIKAG